MFQTETLNIDYRQLYEKLLEQNAAQEALIASLRKEAGAPGSKGPPMSNLRFEFMTNLQYKVKSLSSRVKAFEAGEKFTDMKSAFKKQLAEKDREIQRLKAELAAARSGTVTVRQRWSEVFDDLDKEHKAEMDKKGREIKALKEKLLETQKQLDAEKDKLREMLKELYEARTQLDDSNERIRKLMAQINRDHENSSIPSSLKPNHKKIANSRVKSGKKPGGQAGHKHHPRKRHEPSVKIDVPPPEEYVNNPNYTETGRVITKQVVDIQLNLIVTEYSTPEFRDIRTGVRVSAEFPRGLTLDVTYGGSVKALAFLLNNHCNVSIGKVSEIISELTGGQLNLSAGMICGLSRQFSLKTQEEQKKAFADMLLEPVMNVDFTTIRVNGKNVQALVCSTPNGVLYFAKPHKGHEGVKGTPIENYQWTLVHDHDVTFYNYGGAHQECNDHPLRYLKGNMENEPNMTWSALMRGLIQEMIHFRKHLDPEDKRNPDEIYPGKVKELEARYDEILEIARKEYEYEPPGKYNKDGFNLYGRLAKYKSNHLLFLHDRRVPYTNSRSERLLRILKRKQHQVMAFRSFGGVEALCECLGTLATLKLNENNLYEGVASVFDRLEDKDIIGA